MYSPLFSYIISSCGGYSEDLIGFSHEPDLGENVLEEKIRDNPQAYNLRGYMDLQGNVVIPQKYYESRPFSGGMAAVQSAEVKTVYVYWDDEIGDIVTAEPPEGAPDPRKCQRGNGCGSRQMGLYRQNRNTVVPFTDGTIYNNVDRELYVIVDDKVAAADARLALRAAVKLEALSA